MQFDATGTFVYGTILARLAAGVGWLAAHRRRKVQSGYEREIAKSERKTDFLSFMDAWRTEIESEYASVIPTQFDNKCADFRTQAAKIRLDYGAEFWRLSNSLSSLCSDRIDEAASHESPPKRDKLLGKLMPLLTS